VSPTIHSLECARCQSQMAALDRYCRSCGAPAEGQPDYVQDLYQSLVEAIPAGLFTLDHSERVLYWNRAMEEHTGRKRRDALGRRVFEVLPQLQPFGHRIIRVFETALPLRLDQVTHASGPAAELTQTFWFGPVLTETGSSVLLGMMEDITHKVRVDNQLIRSERLAAIGELAAGVAHNFNNIMAAIGGDAQLLKLVAEEEQLPPHVVEAAEQIYEETMRGGRIAHDLLSFARGAEPQLQRLDVGSLVQDAVRLIKNHPAARSVTMDLDLAEGLPAVDADANQLHQVFFNLILNALQAMPNGGMLTISTRLREHDRHPHTGMLDVKFHDTGAGIPREQLRRIFDPFYSRRANGTMGSGLGLPVSLAMVKSVGGDIQITSAEGIGTTVTVSLPIVERRISPRDRVRRMDQGRALIVDDSADVRRTLTTLLTRRGFEVLTATDGEEAAARVAEAAAGPGLDVVLLEVMLPKGDGFETMRRIRSLYPGLPLVVLTGATDPLKQREALEHGARFAFSKPPSFTELLAVVERLSQGSGSD
jgi:PAS domain S-box-containing protein